MTIDISPEAVAAFLEKHDITEFRARLRMADSPMTPFGQALFMLAALSAEVKRLQETCGGCEQFENLRKERDALKADISRKDEALKAIDNGFMMCAATTPDGPFPLRLDLWHIVRVALQPAKEPSR